MVGSRGPADGKQVDLKLLFLSLQRQLAATLEAAREVVQHPGTKGDVSEAGWRKMLADYLPSRYQVSKAFVVDSDGYISDQLDVVIHDRHYSPLIFNQEGATYVPAESVYAVFEVKQELTKEMVEYAGAKAASVRRLFRTSIEIPHAGGRYDAKQPIAMVAGILCLDSTWKPPLGKPFEDVIGTLSVDERLDLGCVLRHAGFDIAYKDDQAPTIEQSDSDVALVFFFIHLLAKLQQLGTVSAMDLWRYGRILKSEM